MEGDIVFVLSLYTGTGLGYIVRHVACIYGTSSPYRPDPYYYRRSETPNSI